MFPLLTMKLKNIPTGVTLGVSNQEWHLPVTYVTSKGCLSAKKIWMRNVHKCKQQPTGTVLSEQ